MFARWPGGQAGGQANDKECHMTAPPSLSWARVSMSRARAPAGNRHCGIFPHFYLYIYNPPPPLFSLLSVFLCVYQKSSFYMAAGLPPHTPSGHDVVGQKEAADP